MFGTNPFYHGVVKRYTVAFGKLFSDLVIERVDGTKKKVQIIKVPVSYGPKEKWLRRLQENPDLTKQVKMDLPRMSFELINFSYDPSRKIGPNPNYLRDTKNRKISTPMPWNFDYSLYIVTRTQDDMMNIMEQILSFFGPSVNMHIQIMDDPEQEIDIPLVYNNITMSDNWDDNFEESRLIVNTINFTLKGFLYGPIMEPKIIKRAIADITHSETGTAGETYTAEVAPFETTNKETDSHTVTEDWVLKW